MLRGYISKKANTCFLYLTFVYELFATHTRRLPWLAGFAMLVLSAAARGQGAPTGLTVDSTTASTVTLSWTAPVGGTAPTAYNVYRCDEPCTLSTATDWMAWVDQSGGTDLNVTDTNDDSDPAEAGGTSPVVAGKTYRYVVASAPSGNWSNQVTAIAQTPQAPAAPTGLSGSANSSKVVLSWTAPAGTVTGYTLYRGDGSACNNLSSSQTGIAAGATSVEDTSVTSGSTYCYAISATNNVGEGSKSGTETVKAVTVGKPTGLTVTSTSATTIRLRWTAPTSDGGGSIEAYNVYRCEQGAGQACTPTWIAWVDDGTTFTDTHDDSTSHEAGGTSPITEGNTYRYDVAAYRVSGGSRSDQVTGTANPPALPLKVSAITGDDTINIAEKAAGFSIGGDTGSESGVSVTVSVGETDLRTVLSSTANPATWSVSVPANASYITGTSVDVSVSASKTGFSGSSVVERTLTVDLTAPTVPTYTMPPVLIAGVEVTAMSPTGGSGIDRYSAKGLPPGLSIHSTTGTITGTPKVTNASTAKATVTVSDTAGNTDTASITFPPVKAAEPDPPRLGKPQASETKAALSWMPPTYTGAKALTGYNLYRGNSDSSKGGTCDGMVRLQTGIAAGTTYVEDTTVSAGGTYCYAVTAINHRCHIDEVCPTVIGFGESGHSNTVTVTAKTPGAPASLKATSTSPTAIALSWTAPAEDGGGALDGYNVYRCEEGVTACTPAWTAWVDDGTTYTSTYTDSAVTAGTEYRYAVGASRLDGRSNWSNEITAVALTPTKPDAPTGLKAQASETKAALSWTAPSNTGSGKLTGYSLYRGDGNACNNLVSLKTGIAAGVTWVEDTAVSSGSTYCYAVTASNSVGESSRSTAAAVTANTPGAPGSLQTTSTSITAISLSWTAPADDGGGALDGYNVYRCEEGGSACTPAWIAWVDDGTSFTDTHDDSTDHEDGASSPIVANTTYRYAVGASRLNGRSNWSNEITAVARTSQSTLPPTTPLQPQSSSSVPSFASDAQIGDLIFVTGRSIEPVTMPRASGGDIDANLNGGELSDYSFDPAELPEGLTFDRFTRVLSGTPASPIEKTSYTLWVHDDDSDYSVDDADNLPFTITIEQGSVPSGSLTAQGSETKAQLRWVPPAEIDAGQVVSQVLFRAEGNTCTGASALALSLEADGRSAEDGTVSAGSTYCYEIRARNVADNDIWTATAVVTAKTPGAPSTLTAASGTDNSIELSWSAPMDDGGGALDGYNVFRCEEAETACTPSYLAWIPATVGTTYTDSEVTAGTEYRYAVGAARLDGLSNWSNEVTFTAGGEIVAKPNLAPSFADGAEIGDLSFKEGVVIDPVTLPRAGGGDIDAGLNGGELSDYSLDPAELPEGLTFDRFTGVLSGTPSRAAEKIAYTLWVHDDDGDYSAEDADTLAFTIAVEPKPNSAPRFTDDAEIGDLVFTEGVAIDPVALPRASGGDIDSSLNGGELSDYSFDPVELPEGLSFDRFTGVLEGTPTQAAATTAYTLWVHDDDEDNSTEDADSLTFTIAIEAKRAPEAISLEARAVTDNMVLSMARSMLSSAVPTISRRFTATPETSQFSIAGQRLTLNDAARRIAGELRPELGWGPPGIPPSRAASGHWGNVGAAAPAVGENRVPGTGGGSPISQSGAGGLDRLWSGSRFAAPVNDAGESEGRWTLWGSGDVQWFESDSNRAGEYTGDMRSGYLGVDRRIRESGIVGVALWHSIGSSGYTLGDSAGDLEMDATVVLPYARWLFNGRDELWAILGAGTGERRVTVEGSVRESGELSPKLAAFGGRRTFEAGPGGIDWNLRGDAQHMRVESVYGVPIETSRVRLGLEGSSTFALGEASAVRPFLELGVRYDTGGDAHAGTGMELVSGAVFRHSRSGFWLEGRGRVLMLHSSADYEERGFSLTAGLQPRSDGAGMSLLVSPQWGGPVRSANAIWRDEAFTRLGRGRGFSNEAGSWRAEASYGLVTPRTGGLLTPFGELKVFDDDRGRARLGTRYRNFTPDREVQIELSSGLATRTTVDGSVPSEGLNLQYEIWLRGELRF